MDSYVCVLIVVEIGGGQDVGERCREGASYIDTRTVECLQRYLVHFHLAHVARLRFTPLTVSPSSATSNVGPRASPVPPPRNGHARCRRLCKRSLSTLWVEVYGWAEGKCNCSINVFLVQIFGCAFVIKSNTSLMYKIYFEIERN